MEAYSSRNPEKNYGKVAWSDIASTLLATDYKSPPICLLLEDDIPSRRGNGEGVVGYINSSQDGAICCGDAIVPCLTSGHGNCPKVVVYESMDASDEGEGS